MYVLYGLWDGKEVEGFLSLSLSFESPFSKTLRNGWGSFETFLKMFLR